MTDPDPTMDSYNIVRSAILDGQLPPGQIYSQAELSEVLGVGRTPLREAVRRLQSEALLEQSPRRRLRIAPLTLDDLGQLYSMRVVLESLAVRLTVPHLTDAELDDARKALDEHIDACTRQDLSNSREPHRQFHRLLYARCGERMLPQVDSLWDQAQRYRRMYVQGATDEIALLQLAMNDHEEIYAAAVERDAVACSELVARHLTRTALTVFARLADPGAANQVTVAHDFVCFGGSVKGELQSPVRSRR
ncbi:GntR family transcriptional regulator [Amycolatopsis ultiminotia]|uniref:GntR family transcriptional regulator n=1 Tax=Amycolatopsis ultiminotia TaxID=543629 RepID=A0ABP6XKR2_9PSEU